MLSFFQRFTPFFLLLFTLCLIEGGLTTEYSEARSMRGGRSFRMAPRPTAKKAAPRATQQKAQRQQPGFGRSLAGGLLGGALGAMLFGSLFGMGGTGMGLLPLLLLAGVGYFLFRRFTGPSRAGGFAGSRPPPPGGMGQASVDQSSSFPIPPVAPASPLEEGLDQIRETDPQFDEVYFTEVASDVFFKIQAGWMRRDIDSLRHLLGEQLAAEYQQHFAEMTAKGQVNKLESIAVRSVELVAAGSDGQEDFVTIHFTASLLDYTEDEKTGEVLSGSTIDPVKFDEKWTWARPVRTENWRLEGIEAATG